MKERGMSRRAFARRTLRVYDCKDQEQLGESLERMWRVKMDGRGRGKGGFAGLGQKMERCVRKQRPTLYEFFEVLQQEQAH